MKPLLCVRSLFPRAGGVMAFSSRLERERKGNWGGEPGRGKGGGRAREGRRAVYLQTETGAGFKRRIFLSRMMRSTYAG